MVGKNYRLTYDRFGCLRVSRGLSLNYLSSMMHYPYLPMRSPVCRPYYAYFPPNDTTKIGIMISMRVKFGPQM